MALRIKMTGRREWSKDRARAEANEIRLVLRIMRLAIAFAVLWTWAPGAAAQQAAAEDTARVIRQNQLENRDLRESSALAASRRVPGLFWTLNDSGNPPELFATDSGGRDRGSFRVNVPENRDWEALALARCGETDCLYIGEIGDNRPRFPTAKIYRVAEPAIPSPPGARLALDGVIEFRYQDGARNAEAMVVTPEQDVYIISKERAGGGRLYRLDHTAWKSGGIATAVFVSRLPFPDGLGFQVTDAALAADGSSVAVRTYSYIFFFRLERGTLVADPDRRRCYAAGLDAQGEGITWLKDGRLATSSERIAGLGGTVAVVECR